METARGCLYPVHSVVLLIIPDHINDVAECTAGMSVADGVGGFAGLL